MEKISYKFEIFEGPLDLLIHLIKINKIDICDIPIALVLTQYINYVESYKITNPEIISDFALMASTLLLIKSKMLLPKAEDEEDPRAMLVDMLSEYIKYKEAAGFLEERSGLYNDVFTRTPLKIDFDKTYDKEHAPEILKEAYNQLLQKLQGKLPPPAEVFTPYVSTVIISVGSKIKSIFKWLLNEKILKFGKLFEGVKSRSEIVATFLAVLELSKENKVLIGSGEGDETEIILPKTEMKGGDK